MSNNQDLPTILRAALRAYEQARAVRLQAELFDQNWRIRP